MTEEQQEPRIGTLRYVYKNDTITSFMFDYSDESDEPTWHQRWQESNPIQVQYILRMYEELAETGEHVIY